MFQSWYRLQPAARLYLLHVALLAASGSIAGLLFNLAILQLGYPRTFLGLLDTVAIASAALLSLPLWALAHRLGQRNALIINAAAQTLFLLIVGIAPQTAPLLVGVAIAGAAGVFFEVSAAPLMMQASTPATRDTLFSASAAVRFLVAGVATLGAGQLPTLFGHWLGVPAESPLAYRAAFLVAAAGVGLAIVPLLFLRAYTPSEAPARPASAGAPNDWQTWLTLLRTLLPLAPLFLSPLLISIGASLLIPYLNLFFKERFLLDDRMLGGIFAILGLAVGAASLLAPRLSRRLGRMQAIVLTQVISLPFLALLGTTTMLPLAVLGALCRGALFNMNTPLYEAYAMEQTPEALRTTVMGLLNGASTAGFLISPAISTWVQQEYGFGPLFVATGVCYALAAATNYWFFLRRIKN